MCIETQALIDCLHCDDIVYAGVGIDCPSWVFIGGSIGDHSWDSLITGILGGMMEISRKEDKKNIARLTSWYHYETFYSVLLGIKGRFFDPKARGFIHWNEHWMQFKGNWIYSHDVSRSLHFNPDADMYANTFHRTTVQTLRRLQPIQLSKAPWLCRTWTINVTSVSTQV